MSFSNSGHTISETDEQLRDIGQELEELVKAAHDRDQDADVKLANFLASAPANQRQKLLELFQEMLRKREEERQHQEQMQRQQQQSQEQAVEQERRQYFQWLTHLMSEETIRKIRVAFMSNPMLQRQVQDVGQEMARKGVLGQVMPVQKQNLGELSANINTTGVGRGRDDRAVQRGDVLRLGVVDLHELGHQRLELDDLLADVVGRREVLAAAREDERAQDERESARLAYEHARQVYRARLAEAAD